MNRVREEDEIYPNKKRERERERDTARDKQRIPERHEVRNRQMEIGRMR